MRKINIFLYREEYIRMYFLKIAILLNNTFSYFSNKPFRFFVAFLFSNIRVLYNIGRQYIISIYYSHRIEVYITNYICRTHEMETNLIFTTLTGDSKLQTKSPLFRGGYLQGRVGGPIRALRRRSREVKNKSFSTVAINIHRTCRAGNTDVQKKPKNTIFARHIADAAGKCRQVLVFV